MIVITKTAKTTNTADPAHPPDPVVITDELVPPGLAALTLPGPAVLALPGQATLLPSGQTTLPLPGHADLSPPGQATRVPPNPSTLTLAGQIAPTTPGRATRVLPDRTAATIPGHTLRTPSNQATLVPSDQSTLVPSDQAKSVPSGETAVSIPRQSTLVLTDPATLAASGESTLVLPDHTAPTPPGASTLVLADPTAPPAVGPTYRLRGPTAADSARNICMMHTLERIAVAFNAAGIPLMALKGAALNLTVYHRPDERAMLDLDLMVHPGDLHAAREIFNDLGALHGDPQVRDDFFPRFHYETDFTLGQTFPVRVDLHVRPLRPLRYAQLMPADALWQDATTVRIGDAHLLIPGPEAMLIHLAAHAAVHGHARTTWQRDLHRWVDAHRTTLDWDRFIARTEQWHLVLPVRTGLRDAERGQGAFCPSFVRERLRRQRVGWRDRLTLAQAPRDAAHPKAHVAVNALCTPGLRFVGGYLAAVMIPGRDHMADWYGRHHRGWLLTAHLLRLTWPIVRHVRPIRSRLRRIEVRPSGIHGRGVVTCRPFPAGGVIARFRGTPVDRDGPYVVWQHTARGKQRVEMRGPLRFLNHSCRPNAELRGATLVALKGIPANHELTIDYGEDACTCRRQPTAEETPSASTASAIVD